MVRDTVEQQMGKLAEEGARGCACGNIRQAARAVTQLFDEALRPAGLRATQFGILGATMVMGPLTVTKLAEVTITACIQFIIFFYAPPPRLTPP